MREPSLAKRPIKRGKIVYNRYVGSYAKKTEATKEAKMLRENGFYARVILQPGEYGNWAVYARKKMR